MAHENLEQWWHGYGTRLAIAGLLIGSIAFVFDSSSVVTSRSALLGLGILIAGLGQGFHMIERRLSRLEAASQSQPGEGTRVEHNLSSEPGLHGH